LRKQALRLVDELREGISGEPEHNEV